MPQSKGLDFFYQFEFCSLYLFNEASDSQFSAHGPNQDGATLETPWALPADGVSSEDRVRATGSKLHMCRFFKGAFKWCNELVSRTSVALFWNFLGRVCTLGDFKNMRCHYKSLGTISESRFRGQQRNALHCRVCVLFAGLPVSPGRVWLASAA